MDRSLLFFVNLKGLFFRLMMRVGIKLVKVFGPGMSILEDGCVFVNLEKHLGDSWKHFAISFWAKRYRGERILDVYQDGCRVDQVSLYDKALNSAEIKQLSVYEN